MGTLADVAAELAHRSDAQLLRLFTLRPDAINPPVANFAALATRLCGPSSILAALDALNVSQLHALTVLHSPAATGTEAAHVPATLAELHEMALLTAEIPASPASQTHADDGGTQQFCTLASVGLALGEGPPLGDHLTPPAAPPSPKLAEVRTALRDNAAASAVETLLRVTAELVESIGHAPLAALRDRGAGVRTVRKLAVWLEINEAQLCFYLELAATAHLISYDRASAQWRAATPDWLLLERPAQWLALAKAWQDSTRLPFSDAPNRPAAGSPAAKPLAVTSTLPHLAALRHRVLRVLAAPELAAPSRNSEPPNTTYAPTLDSVVAQLAWRHPRQSAAMSALVPGIMAELELLGLTGAGALSITGRCAAAHDWPAALAALDSTLPAPIDHFVIQGDLSVVAPGFLAPAIAAELKLLAATEGRGAAGIFRISEGSLQGAMAAGQSKESILGFLRRHCRTELPQSLEYLIGAAAAKHPAGGARPDSPASTPRRGPDRTTALAWEAPQPTDDVVHLQMQAQLAQLRRSPVWGSAVQDEAGPALVMEQLRLSIASGNTVWLSAVNGSGDVERVLLVPLSLVGGLLRARLNGTGRERHFSIHRITAVEDPPQEGTELP
ncbi:helicase-associated domain-containing protein [Arthrobacter glacialis]|uniref:helicase-associated domain-containing protein n=1 Tax=Arthrobacter glacialis TaxID=1664 RepID=UPI000CD3F14D|nr:helicase-associated domain-containing protein [Arthrobacter glacialis]POH60244.1 hypothetical protein CVS28_04705 [Arthrobacter glacialis]